MESIPANKEGAVTQRVSLELLISQGRGRTAFSLTELLAVMAVTGLLAAVILPAVSRTKVTTRVQKARIEIAQIVSALTEYRSVYGRFPVSAEAVKTATALQEDMTYGGFLIETRTWLAGPSYFTDNSEIIPGLLGLEYFGDGTPTFNFGHVQNPQRRKFLEAPQHGGTNAAPGVGIDGLFRDPWGSPYIVTLDLNGDGRARDVMYRQATVSADPANPEHGLCGMVRSTNAEGSVVFEASSPILVWSPGPDHFVSTCQKANEGFNRDNILSCAR